MEQFLSKIIFLKFRKKISSENIFVNDLIFCFVFYKVVFERIKINVSKF